MPDFPIVDTHLHLWDPAVLRYPWLDDIPLLNQPHLIEDYRKATSGVEVEAMVFVQCEADFVQFRDEERWVESISRNVDQRIRGIIPWAPLEDGDEAEDEIAFLAQNPRVKGIRRIIQFESEPGFCLQPDFVRGVQLLSKYNLHFEICIKGDDQFRNTISLVKQCPDVRFILDHIAKPFIADGTLEPWRFLLQEYAALPNTWCKMSGLVNEADMENWKPTDLAPYIDSVFDSFGTKRVMFGGDWPVCRLAGGIGRWIDVLSGALSSLSPDEQLAIFAENAKEFYRLDQSS